MESTKPSFHSMHFDSIQVLRGIAALFVVAEHIRFLACGAFGVDIFFCISGFMIMFTTHKSTAYFFRKRLLRILPFYWFMTLCTFALLVCFPSMFESTTASLPNLMKSLFFIPFDIGGGVLQPIVRIGWTVNCEMFFYLIFWISYRISHKYRGLICSGFLFLLCGLGTFFPQIQNAPFRFYTDPVMLEFAFGILCYYLAKGAYSLSSRISKVLCMVSLCMGNFLLFFLAANVKNVNILGWRRPLIWGLPAMLIVLCFFIAGLHLKMPKPLVQLGNISFSLYLIHYYPVMFLDRFVFDFSSLRPASLCGSGVAYLIVILCALGAWYLIEHKLTDFLKRKLLPVPFM